MIGLAGGGRAHEVGNVSPVRLCSNTMNYRDKGHIGQGDAVSAVSPFVVVAGGPGSLRSLTRPQVHPHRASGGTICNFTWRSCRGWL